MQLTFFVEFSNNSTSPIHLDRGVIESSLWNMYVSVRELMNCSFSTTLNMYERQRLVTRTNSKSGLWKKSQMRITD